MTPDWRIRADGRDITAAVRGRLLSLRIEDSVGVESDALEVVLDDRDRAIELPPTGAKLDVELGWVEQGLAPMGQFVADAVELGGPPRALTVRAEAADLLGGLKARRTQDWDYVTLGDLAGAIAGANGLRAEVDPTIQGLILPHIDQVDESDLSVLRRLVGQLDVVARPAGGALVVIPRHAIAQGQSSVATVRETDATEYRLVAGDRDDYGAVKAQWKFTTSATPMSVKVGGGEPVFSLPGIYPDEGAARNAATAKLRALERGTTTAHITLAVGLPAASAELPLTLAEFGAPFDGRWVIIGTEHALSDAGYVTKVNLERPAEPWARTPSVPR